MVIFLIFAAVIIRSPCVMLVAPGYFGYVCF